MTRYLLVFLLFSSGCAWTKEKVGSYVTEAVVQDLEHRLDKELAKRDLSLAELRHIADTNKDGKVSKAEVMQTAKDVAGDLITLKVDALKAEKKAEWQEAKQNLLDRVTADGRRRREEERERTTENLSALRREREAKEAEMQQKIAQGTATPEDLAQHKAAQAEYAAKIKAQEDKLAEQGSLWSEVWLAIKALVAAMVLGLVSYLGKQWRGAGKHAETKAEIARTQERQAAMEKFFGVDLNKNGVVGAPGPVAPPAEA
jgi:hypothetical protein